jgi:hypothetical protein
MKTLFSLAILIILSLGGKAQSERYDDSTIFDSYRLAGEKYLLEIDGPPPLFDAPPIYPLGFKTRAEFDNYLTKAINYPAKVTKSSAKGRIVITLIIEKNGSTSNGRVELPCSDERINKQALTTIKKLPKWKAPIYNGKPVRLRYVAIIPVAAKN